MILLFLILMNLLNLDDNNNCIISTEDEYL